MSHSRCIDGLDILFLVVGELVGDGQRATNPIWRRIHVEVLVALYGARLESVVGEVTALQGYIPLAVLRSPAQFGV